MITLRAVPAVALFALLWALPSPLASQADGDPIRLGHYRVLPSEVLGEDRVLQVHLPPGYEDGNLGYPVVYLFYSDWVSAYFAQVVHELSLLTIDRMPEVILVGIPNTQRYRDLLAWPQEGRPGTGQADTFLRFVTEELFPFVESEYRTRPFRIMVGPQAAAVFGAYALLNAPEAFQAFVLNDPCRQDTRERSLCRAVAQQASDPGAEPIFFSVSHDAGDTRWSLGHLERLRAELAAGASQRFRWRISLEEAWPFFLAPLHFRESLLELFAEYPFEVGGEAPTLSFIRAHHEGLSNQFGFRIDPPSLILASSSDRLAAQRDFPGALEILTHLMELYPASLDGPWRLANLHREMGDTATAIRYYEECLLRDPEMLPAKEWLERLRR